MINRAILVLSFALPLAACGSPPAVDEENASVEEVSEKVREASRGDSFVRPGKWVSTVSIEAMEMPGMPPQAAEQVKRMAERTHTTESCLSPEDARQPKGNFFGGNENCRYDHFRMGSGKIDAEMRCTQEGVTQVMAMDGTYSPESYQMRMKATTEGGPAGGNVTMQMKVEAKRVGECTGKEA